MIMQAEAQAFYQNSICVLVEIISTQGASPRKAGSWMLVSATDILGTIGGGRLELLAVEKCRELMRLGQDEGRLDIPLGPEIGQCCGGRVQLQLRSCHGRVVRSDLLRLITKEQEQRPHLYVFGAGHLGQALARAAILVPVHLTIIDSRPEWLAKLPAGVRHQALAIPESVLASAPDRTAIVVVSHDHGLDFAITAAALAQNRFPYVGMIGSVSKRVQFERFWQRQGEDEVLLAQLACPMAPLHTKEKRPEMLAALILSDVLRAFMALT